MMYKITPKENISQASLQLLICEFRISGPMQPGVPQFFDLFLSSECVASPKSIITGTIFLFYLLNMMFSNFMSLCNIFLFFKYYSPFSTFMRIYFVIFIFSFFLFSKNSLKLNIKISVTINTFSELSYRQKYLMTFLWSS